MSRTKVNLQTDLAFHAAVADDWDAFEAQHPDAVTLRGASMQVTAITFDRGAQYLVTYGLPGGKRRRMGVRSALAAFALTKAVTNPIVWRVSA